MSFFNRFSAIDDLCDRIQHIVDECFCRLDDRCFIAEVQVVREGLQLRPMGCIIPSSHHKVAFKKMI